MTEFDAKVFDKFLSEASVSPEWIIVHPKIYNGYWSIKAYPTWFRRLFRILGRKLHNKYLYWIGLPIYWETGLRDLF